MLGVGRTRGITMQATPGKVPAKGAVRACRGRKGAGSRPTRRSRVGKKQGRALQRRGRAGRAGRGMPIIGARGCASRARIDNRQTTVWMLRVGAKRRGAGDSF